MLPDLAIRLRRAQFNRALADMDLAPIAPILAPDVVLVAGTDSAVISGRKAQLQAWKRQFSAAARVVYLRTPERIVASPSAPIAFEHGQWTGTVAANGAAIAAGDYTAKWRLVGADWVIEAELYLTLA